MSSRYENLRLVARAVARYDAPKDYAEIAGQFGDYLERLQSGGTLTLGECRSLWRMVDPSQKTVKAPPCRALASGLHIGPAE